MRNGWTVVAPEFSDQGITAGSDDQSRIRVGCSGASALAKALQGYQSQPLAQARQISSQNNKRSPDKLEKNGIKAAEILKAELTDPDSIKECCKDIDVVISTVRPNGFFSDMSEFYNMAKRGSIYLFGNGELRANPIHGEDLAGV